MKKILTLLVSITLVMSLFAACGKKEEDATTNTPTTAPAAEDTDTPAADETDAPAATDEAAKTGLAVITSLGKSKDAGEKDGLAQIDSTVVAVLVGADGKILDVDIDTAQTKVNFSAEGKLVTDVNTTYKSKQELGDEYGMRKASSIGKEWNEQADAFAAYVVGKTVEEVTGIALDEEGVVTDADLVASVTMGVDTYIAAIEKAVANAQDLGAKAGDKLGLAIETNIKKSKDATAEADGLAQAYSTYTALTTDASGKITSAVIDSSQGNVNFSAAGVVTTDLTVAPQTKQELKEAYGMLKNSAIGKEWYEQANAFATYVTGKTVEEVKGIAVTDGKPSDAELASSVSVTISSFISTIEKAAANAVK
ncbi:hypothetical protein I5677_05800 [Mobilitalea sibirica]|uniref:FMN-binding protein n=1 Tax=Mobilitalea sibirica TaxID=1462919 RepID=A0A8J7H216_9FIRM|nr:hypothetical protein [Mobilitalea sibirica]MBH1940410.1 hypothetical protein [Mobilitalea sibirica]